VGRITGATTPAPGRLAGRRLAAGLIVAGLVAATTLVAGCAPARPAAPAPPGPPAPTVAPSTAPSTAPSAPGSPAATGAAGLPVPDHVVIVVAENHAEGQILGRAPYLTGLAATGDRLAESYAVTHPSEPNYLALFAGSTFGLADDSCPHTYGADNLGHQLLASGRTFAGYSESLPADGYTGCGSGRYARKHNPWVNFPNVPTTANLSLARFPTDYADLPTVSFVIPDLCGDMHDCTVSTGDAWLRAHLDGYARWAQTHHSLLVVTFDEDDNNAGNRILTVLAGGVVRPGVFGGRVDHYRVLRTVEAMYGLPCLGAACGAEPVTGVWR